MSHHCNVHHIYGTLQQTKHPLNIFCQNVIKAFFWPAIKVMAPGIMTYVNNKYILMPHPSLSLSSID